MIEISHLVKKYGDHYAVKDLNVRIEEGQIYGFLGPNGAGKSTTMNMITGYLAPTAGTVKVDGFDIVKEPEKAKEHIGYLPEIPPLYSEMTVEEYLKFAAELKRIPGKERAAQIEKAIKTAQLEDVRKRLINNLSKGYKQRVGLAQAVLGDPETIILDEPTVGLDPRQMIEMRELIPQSQKRPYRYFEFTYSVRSQCSVRPDPDYFQGGAGCERYAGRTAGKAKGCRRAGALRKGNRRTVEDAFVKSGRRRKLYDGRSRRRNRARTGFGEGGLRYPRAAVL